MLKAKVNIQVFKVDRRLITLFKPFFRGQEIQSSEMSIFFKKFGPYTEQVTDRKLTNRMAKTDSAI